MLADRCSWETAQELGVQVLPTGPAELWGQSPRMDALGILCTRVGPAGTAAWLSRPLPGAPFLQPEAW